MPQKFLKHHRNRDPQRKRMFPSNSPTDLEHTQSARARSLAGAKNDGFQRSLVVILLPNLSWAVITAVSEDCWRNPPSNTGDRHGVDEWRHCWRFPRFYMWMWTLGDWNGMLQWADINWQTSPLRNDCRWDSAKPYACLQNPVSIFFLLHSNPFYSVDIDDNIFVALQQ